MREPMAWSRTGRWLGLALVGLLVWTAQPAALLHAAAPAATVDEDEAGEACELPEPLDEDALAAEAPVDEAASLTLRQPSSSASDVCLEDVSVPQSLEDLLDETAEDPVDPALT